MIEENNMEDPNMQDPISNSNLEQNQEPKEEQETIQEPSEEKRFVRVGDTFVPATEWERYMDSLKGTDDPDITRYEPEDAVSLFRQWQEIEQNKKQQRKREWDKEQQEKAKAELRKKQRVKIGDYHVPIEEWERMIDALRESDSEFLPLFLDIQNKWQYDEDADPARMIRKALGELPFGIERFDTKKTREEARKDSDILDVVLKDPYFENNHRASDGSVCCSPADAAA